jgi:putative membrane protein
MRNALTYSFLLASAALVSVACSSDDNKASGDGGTDGSSVETGGKSGIDASTGGSGASSTGGKGGSGGSAGSSGGSGGAVIVVDGGAGTGNTDAGDASADGGIVALSDAQILDVIDTANAGEVAQGMVGTSRAQSVDVKAFATEMVTQHTAARAADQALAKTLKLTLATSGVTTNLQGESDRIVKLLDAAPTGSFDAIYVDSQINIHHAVLLIIDTALIPQAQAPALKTFLTTTRATVAEHLAMAEALAGDGSTAHDQ